MPNANHAGITKALDREDSVIAVNAEACRIVLHQFRDRYIDNHTVFVRRIRPYRYAMQRAVRELGLTNGDICPQDFNAVVGAICH